MSTEDEIMFQIVSQGVNRMWADYDKSKDGYMTYDEASSFIVDCFG